MIVIFQAGGGGGGGSGSGHAYCLKVYQQATLAGEELISNFISICH